MKKYIALFFLCLLALPALAQRSAFFATLDSAPVADCRQAFYNVAFVPSTTTQYMCNSATGAWTATANVTGLNGLTVTASSGTLTIANTKTVTVNNTLTLAGTDSTTMTFPTTSATLARTDAANTFTGVQTFSSAPVLSTSTLTSGAGTITFPTASITVPGTVATDCGTTSACSATTISSTTKIVTGTTQVLDGASPATVTVTNMPAFTGTTSYHCFGTVVGTAATHSITNVTNQSATSTKFYATNGGNETVQYVCVGS